MPNLKPWIEAQLKKGYSKHQIKESLMHRGYSSSSVASVDLIASEHNILGKSKSNPKLTRKVIIFLVVVVVAVIIFVSLSGKVDEPTKAAEIPTELSEIEVIRGRLIGINDNTFTVLSQGGEVVNVTHEVPEKEYIISQELLDGSLIEIGRDDLLPSSKVIITTFVENGKIGIYSIVSQDEADGAGKGFKRIGGTLVSFEDNTFKLLTPTKEVVEVTHYGARDNFSIIRQLPDKSKVEVSKEELVWGSNVVLVTAIKNGQTFVRSVVILEKNTTSKVKKIAGKLVSIESNIFEVIDKNKGSIIIRNSAPFNSITLKKRLLNSTVVDAVRTELKPGVNVVVSTLENYGQTIISSIVILEQEVGKDSNTFKGKLVKIGNKSITIAREKKLTTLLHNGPINEVPVLKRLPDGITEEINWQELNIGSGVRVFTTTENGESVVQSILILSEAQ